MDKFHVLIGNLDETIKNDKLVNQLLDLKEDVFFIADTSLSRDFSEVLKKISRGRIYLIENTHQPNSKARKFYEKQGINYINCLTTISTGSEYFIITPYSSLILEDCLSERALTEILLSKKDGKKIICIFGFPESETTHPKTIENIILLTKPDIIVRPISKKPSIEPANSSTNILTLNKIHTILLS